MERLGKDLPSLAGDAPARNRLHVDALLGAEADNEIRLAEDDLSKGHLEGAQLRICFTSANISSTKRVLDVFL